MGIHEGSPLVPASEDSQKQSFHVTESFRKSFVRQTLMLLLVQAVALALGIFLFAYLQFWQLRGVASILVPIASVVVLLILCFCFMLTAKGFALWKTGDLPLDATVKDSEASLIAVDNGSRTIEYFVWGSDKPDATVTVLCHGSCTTGKYFNQLLFPDKVLQELNVKAISPSYPGHGGSDTLPYRSIAEWPRTDLEPILQKEGVDTFIVQGFSYGTAHAMATAACFPERCLAMGLNVPYLPEPICRELNVPTDADMILDSTRLAKPWIILPVMAILHLFNNQLSGAIDSFASVP